MDRIQELEEKIKKLENRISFTGNTCNALQQEEFLSYEQDRMYLEILKKELARIKK